MGILTAAQPPGMTPAMRTGESPRRVNPKPFSPLIRWTLRAGYHLFLAENTERGPWGEAETWKAPFQLAGIVQHCKNLNSRDGEGAGEEILSFAGKTIPPYKKK